MTAWRRLTDFLARRHLRPPRFGIGFAWDRCWQATHAFEDFFSPPHLFIYSMHFCATITLAYIAFTPELRRWFAATFRLPLVPFPIPGAIGLAGAGFAIVALAGMFDAIWHTAFGLDETNWSFPHSMLGWGLFIVFLGITSCRVALREWRPIGWPSAVVFGFLIVATSADASSLITTIGKYCFRAQFVADPNDQNYAGQTADTSNPADECFRVTDVLVDHHESEVASGGPRPVPWTGARTNHAARLAMNAAYAAAGVR